MPSRGVRRIARTPDSGYKFKCQWCEDEVYQEAEPQLLFALFNENKTVVSQAVQACIECADDIRESNKKFAKLDTREIRQVRELRPEHMLESAMPDSLKKKAQELSNTVDAKLDKLIDAISGLTQLVAAQVQAQIAPKPIVKIFPDPVPVTIEHPKPKRKILAPPPVKSNAKSTAKKQQVAKPKAKAKPKSRRRS